ncbi:MAG TPA: hypothetical protein DCY53_11695, partial [Desulfobacteraceae bacterium]|nr:hypothetical protein [Desulfobacteraceae bacterium]
MLAKFNNEVLQYGPDAVLPQNLNKEWLATLQKMAEDFLETNYDLEQCKKPGDIVDPILSVCVSEILRSQHTDKANISDEDILKKIPIYSLSLIIEAVNRESDLGIEKPNLENLLSWDRIRKIKDTHPEFIKAL